MRVSTESLDHGHDVCGAQAAENWAEGRLVCRCHDVFLWCYLCFVLLRFRLNAFVEAAALRLIVLQYTGAFKATRVSSFFPFVYLEMSLFPSFFVPLPFSLFKIWLTTRAFITIFVSNYINGWERNPEV